VVRRRLFSLVQSNGPPTKVSKALSQASIGVGGDQNDFANGTRDVGYSNLNKVSGWNVYPDESRVQMVNLIRGTHDYWYS
jgi:hypothetical protein